MKFPLLVFLLVCLLIVPAVAQDTVLTIKVFPKYVGGPLSSTTGLEQPVAFYLEYSGLKPNTAYDQQHLGFLTRSTTSTRGSKWANNSWISPSTKTSWVSTDANGVIRAWAFVRSPSSYIVGIDTALLRVRVNETGASSTVTRDVGYITSLNFSDTAKGATAGAIIYGYVDTVALNFTGKFILAYEKPNDVRPLSAWLIFKTPANSIESDLYTTRTDTLLRRAGYFQLVVPANVKIGKIEIRDSSNTILQARTSTAWTAGAPGSKTLLNFSQGTLVSAEQLKPAVPQSFELLQNYPNPFNPATTISYRLSTYGFVSLRVFDMLGRQVSSLVNEIQTAGAYTIRWDASFLPSGVYLCQITTRDFGAAKKMILAK